MPTIAFTTVTGKDGGKRVSSGAVFAVSPDAITLVSYPTSGSTSVSTLTAGVDNRRQRTMGRTNNPIVLVIEDDPPVRELLADVLDEVDYEVVAAHDGIAALQIMRSLHVDLITLDLDLPGLTGSELLHVIHERTSKVPPVVIISSGAPISRELQAQAQAVVNKPFDIDDLIETIRELLPHPSGRE